MAKRPVRQVDEVHQPYGHAARPLIQDEQQHAVGNARRKRMVSMGNHFIEDKKAHSAQGCGSAI